VLRLAAEPGATATIVNVWATWCEPCKAEMVDLVEFHKAYSGKGVRLILVSADDAAVDADRESAQSFLRKSGVSGVSYILGESTDRFVKAFEPKWGQTVPATFFFDSKGRKSSFKIGRISLQELKSRIVPLLGK
jgi:thiol-disulfide isomerase/thioredoxin